MSEHEHQRIVEGNTGYFCADCGSRVGEYIQRRSLTDLEATDEQS